MVMEDVPETFTSHPHSSSNAVHTLFAVASELGNEPYYALWATSTAILLDARVSLPLLLLWALGMYIGQFLKDNLRLPRPGLFPETIDTTQDKQKQPIKPSASPSDVDVPVIRLETKYAAEFGFPSTHALGAFSLPMLTLLFMLFRYEVQSPIACGLWAALQLFWMFVTPVSRLYRGVHSILDIVGGSLIGFVLAIVTYACTDFIYETLSTVFGVVAYTCLSIALLVIYPRTSRWSNSLGDTALIMGTACGAVWGICLAQLLAPTQPYLQIAFPTTIVGGIISVLRLILTVVIIYVIRLINRPNVYKLTRQILHRAAKPPKMSEETSVAVSHMGSVGKWVHDLPVSEMYIVESVERFIGFFGMGFLATLCLPPLFDFVGLVYEMPVGLQ